MPLRAARAAPNVSAYRPSTPSRPASPAPVLARSSTPTAAKATRPAGKQHSRLASTDSTRLRTSWGPLGMANDFTMPTMTTPLKPLHLVDNDVMPQGVTSDSRNAFATMSFLGRPDHEQDLNLVQVTTDGASGLIDTAGMHPGDTACRQENNRTEVHLADLLTTTTKTKRTRRQKLDHDFEIIPKVRSVIALDDQALPEPEIEEPWDVIYDHEKMDQEPSYASIAALN